MAGPRKHLRTAPGVVLSPRRQLALAGDHIGAVKRIVQAAPARVGSVERIAGIGDRHNKLRPADRGDLGIEIFGFDPKILRLVLEISDLAQERLISRRIPRCRTIVAMPVIDLVLHPVADFQKLAIARHIGRDHLGKPCPETIRREIEPLECLGLDKPRKPFIDLQTGPFDIAAHRLSPHRFLIGYRTRPVSPSSRGKPFHDVEISAISPWRPRPPHRSRQSPGHPRMSGAKTAPRTGFPPAPS